MPGWSEYLPADGESRRARQTASTTWGGVAKDGTPWPRDTQSFMPLASMGMSLVAEILIFWARWLKIGDTRVTRGSLGGRQSTGGMPGR